MATNYKTSALAKNYSKTADTSLSLIERFEKWCAGLEPNRYIIMVGILLIQGNIIVPPALLVYSHFDIGLTAAGVAILAVSTLAVLVSNIALAPMKFIVWTFVINLIITLSLIGIHLLHLI